MAVSVPAVQPYQALFYYSCENVDEVNETIKAAYDSDGFLSPDVEADMVTVVAAEYDNGEKVWAIRDGKLERFNSWAVRKYD